MLNMPIKDCLRMAIYYAPRGRMRLYALAGELSQKYLYPTDLLIGIIGAEGSGKSTLIKGLFPGLELTNDDEGINKRSAPIFDFSEGDYFSGHTFHIDVRYELAFHQLHEIVEAVRTVLAARRRVIVEHFDLIYRMLGFNAQIIFGIGEEVRVYRPSVFGPSPLKIKKVADDNLKFRLMAHSAEDIVGKLLKDDYGIDLGNQHSDVRHGFIIGFDEKPALDLEELEAKALAVIRKDIPIAPSDGDFIQMGEELFHCTGKRIHVKRSSHIENFRLMKDYTYDPASRKYLLVGIVGEEAIEIFDELPPVSAGIRDFDLH
jgi:hypothetical protein